MLRLALFLLLVLATGCGTMPKATNDVQLRLRGWVNEVCDAGGNLGRQAKLQEILDRERVQYTKQSIGFYTPYYNFICNKPQAVLFVIHHDKTDTIRNFFTQPTHGFLDPVVPNVISEGAWDNGASVAVGIELARRGRYVAFTGLEESGLLGARTLAAELETLPTTVIVVDQVGAGPVHRGVMVSPFGAHDGQPFSYMNPVCEIFRGAWMNGPLGLIPRSAWLRWRSTDVHWLTSNPPWPILDAIANLAALPLSRIHGVFDRRYLIKPKWMEQALYACEQIHYVPDYFHWIDRNDVDKVNKLIRERKAREKRAKEELRRRGSSGQ